MKTTNERAEWRGTIRKVDTERRIAAGWAIVAKRADGTLTPDVQGDVFDTPESIDALQDAFHEFAKHSRSGDLMHIFPDVAQLVEMVVLTPDVQKAMGIPDGAVPVGAWCSFYYPETPLGNEAWEGVKSGKYADFSIMGNGVRVEIDE